MKKLILLLLLSCTFLQGEQLSHEEWQEARQEFIYDSLQELVNAGEKESWAAGGPLSKYLCHGTLNARLVCDNIFPTMTAQQINESLRDFRIFVEKFVELAVTNFSKKVGEAFLAELLHAYGHVIVFLENAMVDRKSKRVFVPKEGQAVRKADPLIDFLWSLEYYEGVKLHTHKFYASCIDYLTIMVRAQFLFPCYDYKQWDEVENRWFYWLEKVTGKIHEHPIFGGYYRENVRLFRDVFALWKKDYEKKQEKKFDDYE